MPQSPNKLIVQTLINTFQREVKPEKLYDALNRMAADLNAAYNVIFFGPLEAVDGFALTRLNAASLEGEIPRSFNIAYTDEVNQFWRGQLITEDDDEEPFLKVGFGNLLSDPVVDPTSYFRLGSLADGEFYFSQNAGFDTGAFVQDDASIDSLIVNFENGELSLEWWDNVLGDFRNTWTIAGSEILCSNFDDDAQLSLVIRDDEDVFRLGENAAIDNTPKGWVAIPAKVFAELPAAGAEADGLIGINKTSNRFVFYHSGARYYVTGTSF